MNGSSSSSSSSSSSHNATESVGGDIVELAITYYTGASCRSPTYIEFTEGSSCTNEGEVCIPSDDVSYKVNCSYDRETYSSTMLSDRTYLLIEQYYDDACSIYSSSQTFVIANVCQVASSNSSIFGVANTDGSASVAFYNDSVTCEGDYSLNVTVTKIELTLQSCMQNSDGSLYYRAYSNIDSSSTSSGSSSGSSDGIGTGAIVGIVIAAVVIIAAIVLLVICLRRRRKNKDDQESLGLTLLPRKDGLWNDDDIVASRIPRSDVKVKKLLNRGAYGEVYLGSYDGNPVAVKMLPREVRKSIAQVNVALAEAKLMARMDHPRVMQLVGVAWNSLSDLCVLSEFMSGGDLRALLDNYEADPVNNPVGFDYTKMKIAAHVINGLVYLHSLQPMVLHRDLKSKNILLSANLDAKLTDFGVSRESVDMTMTAGVGTSLWMAPEVLMGDRYDDKADVFSFGVVLAELDTHFLPYKQARKSITGVMSDTAILQLVSMGKLQVEFSSAAPKSIVDLGRRCVSVQANDRPSAAEVLYHITTIAKMEMNLTIEP